MMAYSFNLGKAPFAFAHGRDINASYKDLGAVCDAIRYLRAGTAVELLDEVIGKRAPIPYRRHNKYMGSRHELGGTKGAYPMKAAKEVKTILVNAMANSAQQGHGRRGDVRDPRHVDEDANREEAARRRDRCPGAGASTAGLPRRTATSSTRGSR